MPQSSLTTWLKKPVAVNENLHSTLQDEVVAPAKSSEPQDHNPSQTKKGIDKGNDDCRTIRSFTETNTFDLSDKILSHNVQLRACTKEDIRHLKRLLNLLLPIPYPEKFYKEIIEDPQTNSYTLLAFWHDDPSAREIERGRLVGAIRCRLLRSAPSQADQPMLYLSTLAVLSPYRKFGIATHMLQILTKRAINDHRISSVGAHVWEANPDGLEWYRKRGFRELARESGYYPSLNPQTAVVVKRDISVMDLMKG